jgi:hypothetical protein
MTEIFIISITKYNRQYIENKFVCLCQEPLN